MNYREATEYVKQIQVGAKIKPGLEVTRKLMQSHCQSANAKNAAAVSISNSVGMPSPHLFICSTTARIAVRKAGIIKEHVPVVMCQHDAAAAACLSDKCRERGCERILRRRMPRCRSM